jgi:hypothetical protein
MGHPHYSTLRKIKMFFLYMFVYVMFVALVTMATCLSWLKISTGRFLLAIGLLVLATQIAGLV